jgi:DNA recombination protein RmuC
MIIEILLVIIMVLMIILIFLILKSKEVEPKDIESAISSTWIKLGLGEKISAVETHAKDIRESYRSFEQMLRVPKERASFGEISLETIFSDQLPQDMYGIRERTLDGKIPDAHIRSTVGIICVDSKFPLDNFCKMMDAEDPKEREGFKKQFLKDVQGHFNKIANDYVCPEKGSAEFAFAYIPSEGVYYFLVNEAFEMLRDYTKKGVQVVSPLTLSHKIELIKAGVHAKKLSEDAEKVKNNLVRLSQRFGKIDEIWRVFYSTHFKNLEGKAGELDQAYKKLREEFDRISKMSEE